MNQGPQEKEGTNEAASGQIDQLLQRRILTPCRQPTDNPNSIAGYQHLTIPLTDHDYPASTPVMWNAAYRAFDFAKQANVMMTADPARNGEIFAAFRADERYQGGGAGSGFKIEAVEHLDEIDPLAEAIGAVNIIVKDENGKLKGYNTDGAGYVESLIQKLREQDDELITQKVVILGGGGAANAIAFALVAEGARVVILNRTVAKAGELAGRLQEYVRQQRERGDFIRYPFLPKNAVRFGGEDQILSESGDAACVVNVSLKGAIGEWQEFSALAPAVTDGAAENLAASEKLLAQLKTQNPSLIVSDINEQRREQHETPTLRLARQHGFTTLGGLGMVANQGIQAFMLVHGDELKAKGFVQDDVTRVMRAAVGYQS